MLRVLLVACCVDREKFQNLVMESSFSVNCFDSNQTSGEEDFHYKKPFLAFSTLLYGFETKPVAKESKIIRISSILVKNSLT